MKRLLLYMMLMWTIFCPLLTVFSNPTHFEGHHKSDVINSLKTEYAHQLDIKSQGISWEEGWMVEDKADVDFFSLNDYFALTPHYFYVFVYAGLLIQFFFFFKRKLPFCHYLASSSQSTYLTQRVIRI